MDLFDVITKEINEKLVGLQDTVISGRLASYEEYKALCGEMKGLISIREYIKDLKRQLENSDDE